MCIPQEGEPECKCPDGLVPAVPGWGARGGCIVPNPCDPNPCGERAMCIPQEGRATCKCPPEFPLEDPNPRVRCSPRDPCDPSPCGPGTTCTPNRDGNPICQCLPGLVPQPDTITGCGPECEVDPDCRYRGDFICSSERRCVERPDPCDPNPCGPGAVCEGGSCSCPAGTVGSGQTGCLAGECLTDPECPLDKACEERWCQDPCLSGTCSATDFCRVMTHRPICGYNAAPTPAPPPPQPVVIGERYKPVQQPEQPTGFVVGGRYEPVVQPALCTGGRCGLEPEDRGAAMMMMMDTSGLPVIGIARTKRNHQRVKRRRRLLRRPGQ